jgi:hypothetical protein
MKKIEYLHLATQKVYSCDKEYTTDTEMYWAFQQSTNPKELGFTYERDFTEAKEQEPQTV